MGAGLTITALLVSYTFYAHVKEDLPPIGYFTFTDMFCLMSIVGNILAILVFVRVHWMLRQGSDSKPIDSGPLAAKEIKLRAEYTDATWRLVFPIFIVLVMCLAAVPV